MSTTDESIESLKLKMGPLIDETIALMNDCSNNEMARVRHLTRDVPGDGAAKELVKAAALIGIALCQVIRHQREQGL